MGPIVVMIVAVAIGAMAGEEAGRTMRLLLANPFPRSRVVLEKTGTMVLFSSGWSSALWRPRWGRQPVRM